MSLTEGVYKFDRKIRRNSPEPSVEIVFSFDTTGSMSPYLESVKKELSKILTRLLNEIPNIRVGLIAHGDYCDAKTSYVMKWLDLSNDVDTCTKFVKECGPSGGGDFPECYELVMNKVRDFSWSKNTVKSLCIIGDAPPHPKGQYNQLDWVEELKALAKQGVRVHGLRCGHGRESFYSSIAEKSGGTVVNLDKVEYMRELFLEMCYREQQRYVMITQGEKEPFNVSQIKDKRTTLINLVGACLLSEPRFYGSEPNELKSKIESLAKAIVEEESDGGEFLLKLAVYVRQELYIRSTANYLMALAANFTQCHEMYRKYFSHAVRLPNDVLEIVELYWGLPEKYLSGAMSLPAALRKSIMDKFSQFDEYQLAKYSKKNTKKKKKKNENQSNDEEMAKADEPIKPTWKKLIRSCHIGTPAYHVMGLLNRKYPQNEEEFRKSGLSGEWDPSRAGKKMKLQIPKTWETQISALGNKAEVWEDLIDSKKLPFMAMLRNLRNIIQSGVSDKHHSKIISRLTDEYQVSKSMQFPFRFLNAYQVLDAVANSENQTIVSKYRKALDESIRIATINNVVPLRGKSLVFCDVSGSMKYHEAKTVRGTAKFVQTAADMAILFGLMINYVSEESETVLFSSPKTKNDQSFRRLKKLKPENILDNFSQAQKQAENMGVETFFPYECLTQAIKNQDMIDYMVVISDMIVEPRQGQVHSGGTRIGELVEEYRNKVNPDMKFVCIDLFGSGVNKPFAQDPEAENSKDILVTGYSDQILRYIANRQDGNSQLQDVEAIDKKYGIKS
eukprot:gb/GECH01012491.1/.p1 GENE.gb/GECH01012491.1/~~gb/GECH01012491.1/.p1  ORF type:complete len:786 (+),score=240.94 gb/GECH01012491.1/:1-2358(+)